MDNRTYIYIAAELYDLGLASINADRLINQIDRDSRDDIRSAVDCLFALEVRRTQEIAKDDGLIVGLNTDRPNSFYGDETQCLRIDFDYAGPFYFKRSE